MLLAKCCDVLGVQSFPPDISSRVVAKSDIIEYSRVDAISWLFEGKSAEEAQTPVSGQTCAWIGFSYCQSIPVADACLYRLGTSHFPLLS